LIVTLVGAGVDDESPPPQADSTAAARRVNEVFNAIDVEGRMGFPEWVVRRIE
jgi:hypothetical protein